MDNTLKINVDFEGKIADKLMSFVFDTQDGKYTSEKPILTQITYKRIDNETDNVCLFDENDENIILFGISN